MNEDELSSQFAERIADLAKKTTMELEQIASDMLEASKSGGQNLNVWNELADYDFIMTKFIQTLIKFRAVGNIKIKDSAERQKDDEKSE